MYERLILFILFKIHEVAFLIKFQITFNIVHIV